MTILERYHFPVRRAYKIIRKKAPDLENERAIQMAIKSINNSVGPDGLVPTVLDYGALPCLDVPTDGLLLSTIQREPALRRARPAMFQHFTSRLIGDGLKTLNGPDIKESKTSGSFGFYNQHLVVSP